MRKLLLILAAFSLVGLGCAARQAATPAAGTTQGQSDPDRQAIEQLCLNYARGMNDRDARLILSMFADDGKFITRINGANQTVTKRKYAQLCPSKFAYWNKIGLQAKPTVKNIVINGDRAEGSMRMKYSGPGWSSVENYALKFEKRNGKWIITSIQDE